jgi:hypothetical protein
MKVVWLIKMCLNETCSKVHIGKHFSDNCPIQNGLKQGNALLQILFNVALEFIITKVQEYHVRLKLNATHQCLIYTDDLNLLGDNTNTTVKSKEALTDTSKEAGLEINTEKTQ